MIAIKLNRIDAIKVLCDHDADINHISFENDISPLDYVISKKNEEVLKILITSIRKQKISNWHLTKSVLIL